MGSEEETDLAQKETCEKDRMKDTRDAIVEARKIDENSEEIFRLRAEIAEIEKEIEQTKQSIIQTKKELKDATDMRQEENKEWAASNKDDADAYDTVKDAKAVLEKFYADNMLTA